MKAIILLVSLFSLALAYSVKYEPNRRGIKENWAHRNPINEFQFGLIEGLTKVNFAGKFDCLDEGLPMFLTVKEFLFRFVSQTPEWRAQYNINEVDQMLLIISMDLESRCNVFATLQALILNKLVVDIIYKGWRRYHPDTNSLIKYVLFLVFYYLVTSVDNLIYFSMLFQRISVHHDLFNYGIVTGKVIVFVLSFYFNGFILYDNFLDNFI